MYKKVLVVMLAIVMVFTMTPVVAFADGEMHTVTLKHVDENGFLMEEQPYFEIEVGINESLDAAMEANDYWYEEPVILGYNCNWVKGAEIEVEGQTKVVFAQGEDIDLDNSKAVTEDLVYYSKYEKIGGENGLDMNILVDSEEGIEIGNVSGAEAAMNSVARCINDALNLGEDFENWSNVSDEFIECGKTATLLIGKLEVSKIMTEEELTGLDFGLTLVLRDEEGNDLYSEEIKQIDGAIGFSVEVAEDGEYYVRKSFETEDGEGVIEAFGPRELDGKVYLSIRERLGAYEFGIYEGGDDSGDEEGSEIPDNAIQLECWYFDTTGEYVFSPILIEIEENSTKTYAQVLMEATKQINHYPGMKVKNWTFNGSTIDELGSVAEGGMWFNGIANYEKLLVQTELSYYNEDYEVETLTKNVIVDSNALYSDVYKSLDDMTTNMSFDIVPNDWEYEYALDDQLDEETYWDKVNHHGRFIANKNAVYDKYKFTVDYSYLDGNTVKAGSETLMVENGKTVKDICNQILGEKLNTNANYTWAFNPVYTYDLTTDRIGISMNYANVAVVYDDKTPIFTTLYGLKGNVGEYKAVDSNEVFYVDIEPLTEVPQHELDEAFVNGINEKAVAAASNKYINEVVGINLEYIEPIYEPTLNQYEGYGVGIYIVLYARYDKAVLFAVWYDDNGKQEEQYVLESGGTFELPQKGNFVQFWDLGGPTFGGNYQLSGSKVTVETPWMIATSKYRLGVGGLTEVPAGFTLTEVKNALKEEVQKTEGFNATNTKYEFYDVVLRDADSGESVVFEEFPTEGVTFFIECPEGVEPKVGNFVVSHLITSESHEDYGKTETLEIVEIFKGADGKYYLAVKASSFSPVALAYKVDASTSNNGTQNNDIHNNGIPQTGDNYNMLLWAILAAGAMTGIVNLKKKEEQ